MNEKDIDRTNKTRTTDKNPANRDPITGAPGAHPVGAGVGAAAGGATGAAIGAIGGPVGAAIGLVAGGIVGGLAGKAGGEGVNPTVEDAYWRENHRNQSWGAQTKYDDYSGAYKTGYEGYSKYSTTGRSFEECEADLKNEFDCNCGSKTNLKWEEAKHATRAAWERAKQQGRNVRDDVEGRTETDAPRFGTQSSDAINRQQTGRYEPKERSKP
jgi:hypothetical protein